MVVEEQTLLSSVVLPETYPGSVLLEAFVGAVTLADVADFVRNRADEDVDVGVVGGESSSEYRYANPMLPHVTLVGLVRTRSSNTTSSESCTSGSSQ